ncbi:hypothetical protein [Ructibacterium gallinarum]|uniref:Uncharacterized protein n=1 Tax=Ructibacterium gallinarum TaxID=2779355 RepID=A0A9D5LYF7_9FIRM|nr:hypothetical protein [Ructibacterium gallinarum]MBE5040308.1 hypothetical protein [Ructibacterium gallinarum]
MIKIGNTLILNGDKETDTTGIQLNGICLLTCGLSLRSTVTASSLSDDGFTYCLQRSIFTLEQNELSPQEFNVHWHKKPDDIYPYLALVTLLLLCGVPISLISCLEF